MMHLGKQVKFGIGSVPIKHEQARALVSRVDAVRKDDRGSDVICKDEWGRRVVIQCKRYASNHKVGSEAVQAVAGMYQNWHHADHAILVTISGFTQSAVDTARSAHLSLIDGIQLVRLVEKVESVKATQPRSFFGHTQPLPARSLREWLGEERQVR